jgi:hypothetical protein
MNLALTGEQMNSQENPRSNRVIAEEINQSAKPESGARSNAGKDSTDELDSRRVSNQIDGNRIPVFKRGDFEETL